MVIDEGQLATLYANSIASVSFGQAGLAVLQSFANSVPLVTKNGAVSGGEIDNIEHGVNGLLIKTDRMNWWSK